jgi:hypothetical protein
VCGCSFALTLLADLVLYQPVLDFVISKVNNRVSDAICRRLEVSKAQGWDDQRLPDLTNFSLCVRYDTGASEALFAPLSGGRAD